MKDKIDIMDIIVNYFTISILKHGFSSTLGSG